MYHRIKSVEPAPLGVKGWNVTLECGHKRHLWTYPSDLAFREGCACDECAKVTRFTVKPFDAFNAARGVATRWFVLDNSWSWSPTVATFDNVYDAEHRARALNTL